MARFTVRGVVSSIHGGGGTLAALCALGLALVVWTDLRHPNVVELLSQFVLVAFAVNLAYHGSMAVASWKIAGLSDALVTYGLLAACLVIAWLLALVAWPRRETTAAVLLVSVAGVGWAFGYCGARPGFVAADLSRVAYALALVCLLGVDLGVLYGGMLAGRTWIALVAAVAVPALVWLTWSVWRRR